MIKLIAEVSYEDINLCTATGEEITDSGILQHLEDCTSTGDAEPALQYLMDTYDIEWRTVRCINRDPYEFENTLATQKEITESAQSIYLDSDTDFTDQDNAKMYLIWQAAHDYQDNGE